MRRALTIAGSDSGGGAGIQADLKTFGALGVYGMSAITAVTAQNTRTVDRIAELDPGMVAAQIDAVAGDIGTDAVKTGMLFSAPIVASVADAIRRHRLPNLVIDPVMIAKSGARLLRDDAVEALKSDLLPLAKVVTPNLPEAAELAGLPVEDEAGALEAARRIRDLGPSCVVVKGGHGSGPRVLDLFFDGSVVERLTGERIATSSTHGTGCTLSAAITAFLALGLAPLEAVVRAREYLIAAIRAAPGLGGGAGPVDHFHTLRRKPDVMP
jgi:hydroxymethylpyrimidine/phosphomethylpyrimidine kinase